MASTKQCPYCGGEAVVMNVSKPLDDPIHEWPVGQVSLCDDCARFEWL